MTIQQLKVFLTVCEEMNYTRAAVRCYISRQALRQNISVLEQELHGPLFELENNGLRLTQKGQVLREEAGPVVDAFQKLEARMQEEMDERRRIRIGISHSLVPDYLPNLLAHIEAFGNLHPQYRLETILMQNDEVGEQLCQSKLDCGVVMDLKTKAEALNRLELTEHPGGIHVSLDHPLAGRKKITLRELAGQELCLPGTGPEFRPVTDVDGCRLRVIQSYYQVYYLVREQRRIALNRYLEADYRPGEPTVVIPVEGLKLCSAVLSRPDAESAVEKLREYLRFSIRKDFR